MFFISPAFAQDVVETAGDAVAQTEPSTVMTFAPLIIIFVIFYFLIIRPQNKRIREHQAVLKELSKGDKVVTGGGIVGKITKIIGDKELEIEISKGVTVTVQRHTLLGVYDTDKGLPK